MKEIAIGEKTTDEVINIVLDTLEKSKQALVFVSTKRSAEKQAEDIAKKIKEIKGIKEQNGDLRALSEQVLNALARPTKQCERLARCVEKGIAFHHAGLTSLQREIIEDSFRSGAIKIICCTPTLAYGVDLPAFRSIVRDVKRYGGRFGMNYIHTIEYLQMAGRAGRPKFDKWGEAICIATTKPEKLEIEQRFINGEAEEIFSKLAVEPVLRTYLLSLIAAGFIRKRAEIMDFFSKTFWAYQFKDMQELENKIEKTLKLLEDWGFIKAITAGENNASEKGKDEDDEFVAADKIGDKSKEYLAASIGKRVAELYIDPLTAYDIITALKKAASKKVLKPFSFLQVVSHTREIMPMLKVRAKEWDDIQEKAVEMSPYLLENEPSMYEPEYEDFMDSIKTAVMFEEWIDEKDEEYLLEKYNVRPGEIKAKLDIADWLVYSMEELARMIEIQPLLKEIRKTRLRMKYGVKEELLTLLKLEGIGRVRSRKLFNNKIKDLADVKRADLGVLSQILGKKVAESIKKQVGEEIAEEVSERKRRGQLSLKKF